MDDTRMLCKVLRSAFLVVLMLSCSRPERLNVATDPSTGQLGVSGTAPDVPVIFGACTAAASARPLLSEEVAAAIRELDIASKWSQIGQDVQLYWQMANMLAPTAGQDYHARLLLESVCEVLSRPPAGHNILLLHLRDSSQLPALRKACLSALADSPEIASNAEFAGLARTFVGRMSLELNLSVCLGEIERLNRLLQQAETESRRAEILVEMLTEWISLFEVGSRQFASDESGVASTPLERWVREQVRMLPSGVFLSALVGAEPEIYRGSTFEELGQERFDLQERIVTRFCDNVSVQAWHAMVGPRPIREEE
jgi:hypothetical protein